MNKTIKPANKISGIIDIPSSKSHAQRAVACSLISKEATTILNFGDSKDELTALQILKQSNKIISHEKKFIKIASSSNFNFKDKNISFNEAGLSCRLFTPILANSEQYLILNGNGSLLKRPMGIFNSVFKKISVNFSSKNNKLPFTINGPISPKSISIDGSLSSQFISGLIYAYVGSDKLKTETIKIKNPKSVPYIELSLDVLKSFGVKLKLNKNTIHFNGPYNLKPTSITIENDWSSASFFIVAAAILGNITIKNINANSKQADSRILSVIEEFGAYVSWNKNALNISKNECVSFDFDASNSPDLFPPLAVLASFGSKTSSIKGVERLYAKESNRAQTIKSELSKLGANINISDNTMFVSPRSEPITFNVNSCNDHRIAMAASIFALMLDKPTLIKDSSAVNKSFPSFYKLLDSVTL
ncbi:MAG: 3-phosphoshikimate 1-carboxyvinyltransferase [Flavobacteriales bacterium]|nr:3-phosphoshikimate 1-carboxyvinyltransferase [Flavobacteriales bacterium]